MDISQEQINQELLGVVVDGQLSCAQAFAIAAELGIAVSQVGQAADTLGIKIVSCQLGCF